MNKSANSSPEKRTWRIYTEDVDHPRVTALARRLGNVRITVIDHYKSVFNRPRQNEDLQRRSPAIIAGTSQPPFCYPNSDFCPTGPFRQAITMSPAIGCLFDCDYCFLKGMFNSANLVTFLNQEDLQDAALQAVHRRADKSRPLLINASYESDLLALEPLLGLANELVDWADAHRGLMVELRTKSGSFGHLESRRPSDNVLLAFTLGPATFVKQYERAPSLDTRLRAVKKAIAHGWRVRLCLDPIMEGPNWQTIYPQFIDDLFGLVDAQSLFDLTVGPLRMNDNYLRRVQKKRPGCDLLFNPPSTKEALEQSVVAPLLAHLKPDQLSRYLGD